MSDTIISIENVSFRYEGADAAAVSGVNLRIDRGEFLAVLGRNGSGKSTLAKMLNALVLPTEGKISVDGIYTSDDDSAYEVRTHCGMVFQNPDNQIVSTIVEEDCAFGLENMGLPAADIRKRVDEALKTVGMQDHALSSPAMLSGGQKQRVAIAGVVAMKPDVIVFDESTAMLDPVGRKDIFDLARRLKKEDGITIVWITHFMEEAVRSDRVAVMADGKLTMQGSPREVFSREAELRDLGLDVPEMTYLSTLLREGGLEIKNSIMTVDEMVVELCRLK